MSPIITIAASAGGLEPLNRIISVLPSPCSASAFIVWHIGASDSLLPDILSRVTSLPVSQARDGALIQTGHIYVAPPDHHMRLEPGRIRLDQGPKIHHTRPAADPLFMSAAEVYRERVTGIVLGGGDGDGAEGLHAIKRQGGLTIVQHPAESKVPEMPIAAIISDDPDACLSIERIAERVASLCGDGAVKVSELQS